MTRLIGVVDCCRLTVCGAVCVRKKVVIGRILVVHRCIDCHDSERCDERGASGYQVERWVIAEVGTYAGQPSNPEHIKTRSVVVQYMGPKVYPHRTILCAEDLYRVGPIRIAEIANRQTAMSP